VDAGIEPGRVAELTAAERERFLAERPRSLALRARARAVMPRGVPMSWLDALFHPEPVWAASGSGAYITDVDGHHYLDTNLADTSMFCGYAPAPVVEAVSRVVATGSQFMLPCEDSIVVAAELGRRYGLPQWQFTLSATVANVEAMRLARSATGRDIVVMIDGKYHGHADEMQTVLVDGAVVAEFSGLPGAGHAIRLVPFNDEAAIAAALADRQVAAVLLEPAMTNEQGVIAPLPGYHDALRRIATEHGSFLIVDETHTQICGPGGLTRRWGLQPDIVTLGKSIAAGIPIGAYGMTAELADRCADPDWWATGGTLFGNPLSMAAARAALTEVLTDDVYDRAATLGARLADGIDAAAVKAGLPWRAHRLYPRSGYAFSGVQPVNAAEARADLDSNLWLLLRLFMANHGVWEAIEGAGPAMGAAAVDADVDLYLDVLDQLMTELVR
jgi:glutamate-1-semialdehyde 2,1-aminomutase